MGDGEKDLYANQGAPMDAIWVVSTCAALFPFWGLLAANKIETGTPKTRLTEQFVSFVYRRAGGYGLLGLPVLSMVVGTAYVSGINEVTSYARGRR